MLSLTEHGSLSRETVRRRPAENDPTSETAAALASNGCSQPSKARTKLGHTYPTRRHSKVITHYAGS